MDIARRLLNLFLARNYQLTEHAIESMDEDGLTLNDLISCLATGSARGSWRKQRKYEIEGRSVAGKPIRIVGRLVDSK